MRYFKWEHSNILILVGIICLFSCKKFIEINPPSNELVNSSVFESDLSAASAILGIYSRMSSSGFSSGDASSISLLAGLSSDEFTNFSSYNDQLQFQLNQLSSTNYYVTYNLWSEPYQYICTANSILESLKASPSISSGTKMQIEGEARFVRAFCYFYLAEMFGDVPLDTTSSYQLNSVAIRTARAGVFDKIISDLIAAQNLLSGDYSMSKNERVRPNKWAATALLARAYLYTKNYSAAEVQSTLVINNSLYSLLPDLNQVFLKNSKEAIWQLEPNNPGLNTNDGQTFILSGPPTSVSISNGLINSFDSSDKRKASWIGTYTDGTNVWYFPYKYKVQNGAIVKEYSMVIRLAEIYLIRAEARANLSNLGSFSGAISDLDSIRVRAGLGLYVGPQDQSSVLSEILNQRKFELFSEWGHRWFDIIRTGQAQAILTPIKNGWNNSAELYPIPSIELSNNLKITQNPGY